MASSALLVFILASILGVGVNLVKGETRNIMSSGPITVETSDYYKDYYECVRKVTVSLHGMEAEELETSCEPTSNMNNDGVYQYGETFAIIQIPGTTKYEGLFNVGSYCIKKTYLIILGSRIKMHKSHGIETSNEDCMSLIAGNSLKRYARSRTAKQILPVSRNPSTVARVLATKTFKGPGALKVDTEDFEDDDDCVRVVTVKVHGVPAERLETSCGSTQGRIVNERFQYGKSFTFQRIKGTHNYIGLFNTGESCTRISYHVSGYPINISKSKGTKTTDMECKELKLGVNLIDNDDDDDEDDNDDDDDDDDDDDYEARDGRSRVYRSRKSMGDGPIRVESVEYTEHDECTKELTIKVQGAKVERLETSCGSAFKKYNKQQFQYGDSFMLKRIPGTRNYKGLFNIGENCVRKTIYVHRGYPIKISKSKESLTMDDECIGLMAGDNLVNDEDTVNNKALDRSSGWLDGFTKKRSH